MIKYNSLYIKQKAYIIVIIVVVVVINTVLVLFRDID